MGRQGTALGSVAAIAVLAETGRRARTRRVSEYEERLFRTLNHAPEEARLPVWAVMQSGSLAAVFVVSGELLRRGRYDAAATTCATGVAVWAGVKLVKPLIGRGRPSQHLDTVTVRGPAQTGLGYPSGHSAVALTLALVAFRHADPTTRTIALAAAATTGAARMYVGAHLPLDVAGGFAIGLVCGNAANASVRALR